MQIEVAPGKYIVAVSGGVDSMVLLHVLSWQTRLQLIVAHYDHGIREDSDVDRQLVEETARQYKLPFVCERGDLGAGASEAVARNARYDFLRRTARQYQAQAVITAHHQDDVVETAIINLLRGTGRKGLSSLRTNDTLLRPFLDVSKQSILAYAAEHHVPWREDSTNLSDAYARNYIRTHIVPRLGKPGRAQLLEHITHAALLNDEIDGLLTESLAAHMSQDGLDRQWFIMLPYDVSCETMAMWLRQVGIREFDKKMIVRLVVQAKVAKAGKCVDIHAGFLLEVKKTSCSVTVGTTRKTD